MKKTMLLTGLAALALAIGGCTTMNNGGTETGVSQSMVETISGNLAYRERIALPPGSRMEIVITDITNGPDSGMVVTREDVAIGAHTVPIPFSVDVSKRNLTNGPLYGLRAFIKDPAGTVLFRTSEPFLLNLQNSTVDIGTLMLAMTSADDPGVAGIAGIQDGEWRVTQFNFDVAPAATAPRMTFAVDGRFYGSTGCNNFSTTYALDGNAITLAPMAVTRMACEASLMEQERRFLEVANTLNRVSLDGDGRLVLEGSADRRMVAERSR